MPTEVNGLPTHVLIVHAVVVLIPLTALCVALAAWWPRARRWLGPLPPLLGLVSVAITYAAAQAGEWLEERVGNAPLIRDHTELGEQMPWWAFGLFLVAAGQWVWHRWYAGSRARRSDDSDARTTRSSGRVAVGVTIGVVATAVAVGSVVQVVRAGESGSRAVWEGSYSSSAD